MGCAALWWGKAWIGAPQNSPRCWSSHPKSLACKGFAGGDRSHSRTLPLSSQWMSGLGCFFSWLFLSLGSFIFPVWPARVTAPPADVVLLGTGAMSLRRLRNGGSGLSYLVEMLISLRVLFENGIQEASFSFLTLVRDAGISVLRKCLLPYPLGQSLCLGVRSVTDLKETSRRTSLFREISVQTKRQSILVLIPFPWKSAILWLWMFLFGGYT